MGSKALPFLAQALPYAPALGSLVQGDLGGAASQSAAAYGTGMIPGMKNLAGRGAGGQALATGLQTLGGVVGGNVLGNVTGGVVDAGADLLGMGQRQAMAEGKTSILGRDAIGTDADIDKYIGQSGRVQRAQMELDLQRRSLMHPQIQRELNANQQRYQQNVLQQGILQGQLQRQAGVMNMAGKAMSEGAATDRALIAAGNPYIGKIF